MTGTIRIGTVLPEPTQGVATGKSVAIEVAIELGAVPLVQHVTGDVADSIRVGTLSQNSTQCVAKSKSVTVKL